MSSSDPLSVSAHEFATVRIFTTALDAEEASNITAHNVHRLLGNVTLNPDKVEVVPSKALEGLGLTGYLRAGYGIADKDLAGRRAQLDAVSGLVVLIPASAFGGQAQTIDPHPSVRFLGLFHEEKAEPPRPMAPTPSASGTIAPRGDRSKGQVGPGRANSWLIAIGALLIAAAIVVFVVM